MTTKVIRLDNAQTVKKEEIFTDRIAINQIREIWNDENITYTDEQLIRIREWLYVMAEIIIDTVNDNPHLLIDLNNRHERGEEKVNSSQADKNRKAAA